jgi:nitrate/nitrite transport system permease protein
MNIALSNLPWLEPIVKIIQGDNISQNVQIIAKAIGVPLAGILVFLMIWHGAASNIETSLGNFPGPADVYEQSKGLITEHFAEREKAEAFYERQDERNAARMADDPDYVPKIRDYTGKATYFD